VHVRDRKAAEKLGVFNATAQALAEAFWPGPLTLVVPLQPDAPVARAVTAGLLTIAIRCPAHPVMQALLLKSDLSLAAPSANRSGAISPTRADHVLKGLGGAVPMILDGGPCSAGLESTIVAVRDDGWQLLRPGPVSAMEIEQTLGYPPLSLPMNSIEAPGQMASHYAPSKPVRLNVTAPVPDEYLIGFGAIAGDENLSATGDLAQAAANLFEALHNADGSSAIAIAVAPIPHEGIGIAINDRLSRAAVR